MRFSFVSEYKKTVVFIVLAVMVTLISGTIYVSVQQVYRNDANDPQVEAVEKIIELLNQGAPAEAITAQSSPVDMSKSLSLFIIIYDKDGKEIASSANLNNNSPTLPSGVMDYVKTRNEHRFTWQPEKGVRAAVVMGKIENDGGYVLAGRSLMEVEKSIGELAKIVGFSWLILLLLAAKLSWILGFVGKAKNITLVEKTEIIEVSPK